MADYRRCYVPGGTYFFTLVTQDRRPILTTKLGRAALRHAIQDQKTKRPFDIVAFVLLPNHLHTIWSLPSGDCDYSIRWAQIKEAFTREFLECGGSEAPRASSHEKRRERSVWQRRFWEHVCRDEDDLKRLVDYIHWNPCKHGLVGQVKAYPWSSFHRFVKLGEYDENWGRVDPCPNWSAPGWE